MEDLTASTFVPLRKSLKRKNTGKEDNFMKSYYTDNKKTNSLSQQDIDSIRINNRIEIDGDDCPTPIITFDDASLPKSVRNYLEARQISMPTPIQMQAISCLLHGRDVIGISPTGAGKTLAYLLPLCVFISKRCLVENINAPLALIVVPTRELMQQIFEHISDLLEGLQDTNLITQNQAIERPDTNLSNTGYHANYHILPVTQSCSQTIYTHENTNYKLIANQQKRNDQIIRPNIPYPTISNQAYPAISNQACPDRSCHTTTHTSVRYQTSDPVYIRDSTTYDTTPPSSIKTNIMASWQKNVMYPNSESNYSQFGPPIDSQPRNLSYPVNQSCQDFVTTSRKPLLLQDVRTRKVVGICGGVPIADQICKLKQGVDVIVATPGRLLDLCKRQLVSLDQISYLVIDECDRMLDMGLEEQLRKLIGIISFTDIPRQTSLWSATLPTSLERLARSAVLNPITIFIGIRDIVCQSVEQNVTFMHTYQKQDKLLETLRKTPFPPVIVFCCTIETVNSITALLKDEQFHVAELHSGKSQEYRFKVMSSFKNGTVDVLISTDLASRGLDIPEITHVINYDMPNTLDDYIHRCGRTGRFGRPGGFGRPGQATSFLTLECKIAEELKEMLESTGVSIPKALEDPKQFGKKVLKTQFGDRVINS